MEREGRLEVRTVAFEVEFEAKISGKEIAYETLGGRKLEPVLASSDQIALVSRILKVMYLCECECISNRLAY